MRARPHTRQKQVGPMPSPGRFVILYESFLGTTIFSELAADVRERPSAGVPRRGEKADTPATSARARMDLYRRVRKQVWHW